MIRCRDVVQACAWWLSASSAFAAVPAVGAASASIARLVTIAADATDVSVTHSNHPPTLVAPSNASGAKDVDIAIPGVAVGDADGGSLVVTLTASHGATRVGTSTGLVIVGGNGADTSLIGTVANLNNALATLVYKNAPGYSGPDTLSIQVSDSPNGDASVTTHTSVMTVVDDPVFANGFK